MHQCCSAKPKYVIEYDTGSQFQVCEKCFKDPYWSTMIISKQTIG
ncbi:MAG: hypothetical protein OEM21_02810 [Nitrosopumilus sp.]|nr:hypothetical protein [Nitrosopumilus sp.]